MVGVAQLVEHLVVVQVVAGSSPVTHPTARSTMDFMVDRHRLKFTAVLVQRISSPTHLASASRQSS